MTFFGGGGGRGGLVSSRLVQWSRIRPLLEVSPKNPVASCIHRLMVAGMMQKLMTHLTPSLCLKFSLHYIVIVYLETKVYFADYRQLAKRLSGLSVDIWSKVFLLNVIRPKDFCMYVQFKPQPLKARKCSFKVTVQSCRMRDCSFSKISWKFSGKPIGAILVAIINSFDNQFLTALDDTQHVSSRNIYFFPKAVLGHCISYLWPAFKTKRQYPNYFIKLDLIHDSSL